MSSFRQEFENSTALLEEVPFLARTRLTQARLPGLQEHHHDDLFEIFLLEHGEVEWWVENEVHRLVTGDIYLNRPGERHGSIGPSLRPCGYLWIHVRVAPTPPEFAAGEFQRVLKTLSSSRLRSFSAPPSVRSHFVNLWNVHVKRPAFSKLEARAHLHLLLAELTRCMEKQAGNSLIQSFAIRHAMKHIDSAPGENHTVRSLATLAGLRCTQFNDRFFKETGFTPCEYVRRSRVNLSKKRLLTEAISITDLATELGFSSSQHFATVFRRSEGLTPRDYRKMHSHPIT